MFRRFADFIPDRSGDSAMRPKRLQAVVVASFSVFVSACASTPQGSSNVAETAIVEAEPQLAIEQFGRAVVLLGSGDLDLAAKAFQALSSEYPMYSGPLINLGIAHARAGRLPDAEKALLEALERSPASAAAHNQLGVVYRKLGRFADADAAYSRAIEINAAYAAAHLNLGVLCDLYLQQPERALSEYERYVALTPSPDSRVSGWITELRARIGSGEPTARSEQ